MLKSIVVSLTVLIVSLTVAPSFVEAQAAAPTAEQRTRAREAYTRGQQLFDAGQFEQAQASFEEAYLQVPNPVVLLGVASAQERRGLRAEARATLERYLRESPNARDRAQIEARIATLPAPAAATTGTTTTGTTTIGTTGTTGTATTGTTGTTTSTTATTGTTTTGTTTTGTTTTGTTTATTTGTTTTATTDTPSGTAAEESDAAEAEADAEADGASDEAAEGEGAGDEAPATPAGPSTAVWVLTAVGAVGLVSGTVFGFMALSRQSDFDAMPTLAAADEGEAFALVADISFGVALASGIAAIVLYATEGSASTASSTDATAFRLLPVVTPQGGGVTALGRF